jgi:hypothetical protein
MCAESIHSVDHQLIQRVLRRGAGEFDHLLLVPANTLTRCQCSETGTRNVEISKKANRSIRTMFLVTTGSKLRSRDVIRILLTYCIIIINIRI